ncbi:Uncharacterized protein EJ110_NYTH17268 [Nymphaea thermarum]|nr:Uncharacterized protein EJ110_NYTH17268 [Nymphaea thermarum]
MGNAIAGGERKKVRLMKVDGETVKLKGPVRVGEVVRQYPNHAVLDSTAVKNLGTLAKPLDEDHELKGGKKRLYFLVELQKLQPPPPPPQPEERLPRRARSTGIQMSAKERLESLMLAKRSVSDLTFVKAPSAAGGDGAEEGGGVLRVKMRVPKSQVSQLLQGSAGGADAAQKIIDLCLKKEEDAAPPAAHAAAGAEVAEGSKSGNLGTWKPALGSIQEGAGGLKSALRQKKGVRFQMAEEGRIA